METYKEADFLKTKIEPANYTITDSSSNPKEDNVKKNAEDLRVKEQMAIELKKNCNVHKMGGATLCNTIWGQSDNGVRAG